MHSKEKVKLRIEKYRTNMHRILFDSKSEIKNKYKLHYFENRLYSQV